MCPDQKVSLFLLFLCFSCSWLFTLNSKHWMLGRQNLSSGRKSCPRNTNVPILHCLGIHHRSNRESLCNLLQRNTIKLLNHFTLLQYLAPKQFTDGLTKQRLFFPQGLQQCSNPLQKGHRSHRGTNRPQTKLLGKGLCSPQVSKCLS